jgi:hypothetical protein
MRTCSASTTVSHLWAQDNPHAVHEYGYEVHFIVRVWAGIVRVVVMDPYLLPDRLTAQQYHILWKLIYRGYLKMCL